jgi:ABC-2 type transport system ATP-binding protein
LASAVNTAENLWELTFESDQDMRSVVFDFAQENGLKTLQLNLKNKNLESLFREVTGKER